MYSSILGEHYRFQYGREGSPCRGSADWAVKSLMQMWNWRGPFHKSSCRSAWFYIQEFRWSWRFSACMLFVALICAGNIDVALNRDEYLELVLVPTKLNPWLWLMWLEEHYLQARWEIRERVGGSTVYSRDTFVPGAGETLTKVNGFGNIKASLSPFS